MHTRWFWIPVLALLFAVASCQSSNNSPTCNFNNPAVLAQSTWPKFHANLSNTGAVPISRAPVPNPTPQWVFTAPMQTTISASPVLNQGETLVYIGSSIGTLFALCTAQNTTCELGTPEPSFTFSAPASITSAALATVRNNVDAIFVGTGNGSSGGFVYGLNSGATNLSSYWPFGLSGFVGTAPTIYVDGAVYVGTQSGTFFGVCPNGIARWGLSVGTSMLQAVQSPAAIGPNGTIYFGASDRQLRAVAPNGRFFWAFTASGPIQTAPVVEIDDTVTPATTTAIYLADTAGRVFKLNSSGQQLFSFGPVGPIPSSSPALANGTLYFGSDDHNLYAINTDTGTLKWMVPTGGKIESSPAVATGSQPDELPVIVVGSDDGEVYFVQDDGSASPPVATFTIGAPVRSSPAFDAAGTVYIGADDGSVYAID